MALNVYVSIIILNESGSDVPTKRHRIAEWIRKQDPYCFQETYLILKDKYRLTVKGWKKIFHANGK